MGIVNWIQLIIYMGDYLFWEQRYYHWFVRIALLYMSVLYIKYENNKIVPDEKFSLDPDQARYLETDSGYPAGYSAGYQRSEVIKSPLLSQHNTVCKQTNFFKFNK